MRSVAVISLSALALLASAATATAAAPVLVEVGSTEQHPSAKWTLPPGVQPQVIEIATQPSVASDGSFFTENVVVYDTLEDNETSWLYGSQLDPGTYYVHLSGLDEPCFYADACPIREWSNVGTLNIPAPAAAPAPSTTPSSGTSSAPAATEKAWMNRLRGFLRKVERGANQVAAGNYSSGLANFLVCTARLKTTVGPPPTNRLNRVYTPMKQACRKLEAGARHVVGGRPTQAVSAFNAAVRYLDRASRALSALS